MFERLGFILWYTHAAIQAVSMDVHQMFFFFSAE
ncbi:hypothetical protein M7I_6239 [Glarea lozoyensis 74030]|uniref:Uncharacterized protein n=1 Tax=Glarea lozoyensis (strain ATCC 74030 / MF5533) TaxID=1104152 RepID=H0EU13_GLAL7|nr:hypothetical protein M7I_6239 [Glarea lozoyensis 74030]